MEALNLLGTTMGLGLVSGVNLYATVLTVGLGMRLGLITLSPEMSQLEILANPYVLITAGVIYAIEFLADKIPWVDSLWDAIHTLVRPLGAAAIGAGVVGTVEPATAAVAGLFCGGVALSGHSTKAGTRILINHSPEPFSNIVLSIVEDVFAIFGAWLAVAHPLVMLVIGLTFLALFIWFAPKVFRLIRVELLALKGILKKLFAALTRKATTVAPAAAGSNGGYSVPVGVTSQSSGGSFSQPWTSPNVPDKYASFVQDKLGLRDTHDCVRCVAGSGVKGLRNSVGYLYVRDDGILFVTRRMFRFRDHRLFRSSIEDVQFKKRILFDQLMIKVKGRRLNLLFFKDSWGEAEEVFCRLQALRGQD